MSNKLCLCLSQKRRVIVWLHLRKRPTFSRVNEFLICDLQMNRIPGRSDFRGKHNSKIFVDPYHQDVQLDSTLSREAMSAISTLSKSEGMIDVASIHQPPLETLAQFTDVMFLVRNAMCYVGRADQLSLFFEKWGQPVG